MRDIMDYGDLKPHRGQSSEVIISSLLGDLVTLSRDNFNFLSDIWES